MRRSSTIICVCIAAFSIATFRSASADDSMSSGSTMGLPKDHQYLIGTWTCDVQLAAMGGQGPTTDHGTMTIALSPSMTLHSHVVAKDYMSDSYQGYVTKTKTHWIASSDTQGNTTLETSMNGSVFTGTTWQAGAATPTRDTQSKISDTKIHDVTEFKMNGKWSKLADVVCTKG